jgi:hypothetical protein
MKSLITTLLLMCFLFACSSQKKNGLSNFSEHEFNTEHFSGKVKSLEAPLINKKEGFYFITIKTDSIPIYCTLYTGPVYFSSVHENFVSKSLNKMEQYALNQLEVKTIGEGLPFFETQHSYLDNLEGKRKAGLFKVASFDHNGTAHVCVHDDVEMSDTFSGFIEEFAKNLKSPLYQSDNDLKKEINLIKVNGKFVGFSQKIKTKNSSKTVSVENMSLMVPRSQKDLIASDSLSTQYFDDKGVLTSGIYSNVENSQTKYAMTLTKKAPREYVTSGTFMGEEVKKQIIKTQKDLINHDLDLKRMSHEKNKKAVVKSSLFSPGINPQGMTELKMKYVEKIAGDLHLYEVDSESIKTYLHMRDDGISPYSKSIMGSMVLETFLKYESP